MTEQEWLECGDPMRMLDRVRANCSSRKALLLTTACFQRHWERLPEVSRTWARLAETTAASSDSRQALDETFEAMEESLNPLGPPGEFVAMLDIAWGMWEAEWPEMDGDIAWRDERRAQAALVREVYGNPFRPVTIDPAWLTPTVRSLAHAIYEDRAFDRLPILADALEDAGCDQTDLLAHCRGPGPHVRGCFAVDLLLGKE